MATRTILEVGSQFGRWTVVADAGSGGTHGGAQYFCHCDCGTERNVRACTLARGISLSCGCRNREQLIQRITKHGMYGKREYYIWGSMKARCQNPKDKNFINYGGRGIQVCQQWAESFQAFYQDMGPTPYGKSLERIDNNGNYELRNCKWATRSEQQRNRRSNKILTYDGESATCAEWADRLHLPKKTLLRRLRDGWSVKMALTTPYERQTSTWYPVLYG